MCCKYLPWLVLWYYLAGIVVVRVRVGMPSPGVLGGLWTRRDLQEGKGIVELLVFYHTRTIATMHHVYHLLHPIAPDVSFVLSLYLIDSSVDLSPACAILRVRKSRACRYDTLLVQMKRNTD